MSASSKAQSCLRPPNQDTTPKADNRNMNSALQTQIDTDLPGKRNIFNGVLWTAIAYCCVSCLTLPFINAIWLGELPLLAVIQIPKILFAGWLRTGVVMKVIDVFGLSRGSFSPDYILARPYALAIAYLVPMIVIGIIALRRWKPADSRRGLLLAGFFVAAIVDYVCTLLFAEGRGLTIY
jgi:hypothetical protein